MEVEKEQEVGDLRVLLQSWNVADLLPRLEERAIGTNELHMMKPHHLPELLENVGLGERIRFEHHLERWRHGLNWPLQSVQEQKHCLGCRCATDYAVDTAQSDDSLANSNAETVQPNIEPEPVANEVKKDEKNDEDQKPEALTVLGILMNIFQLASSCCSSSAACSSSLVSSAASFCVCCSTGNGTQGTQSLHHILERFWCNVC